MSTFLIIASNSSLQIQNFYIMIKKFQFLKLKLVINTTLNYSNMPLTTSPT